MIMTLLESVPYSRSMPPLSSTSVYLTAEQHRCPRCLHVNIAFPNSSILSLTHNYNNDNNIYNTNDDNNNSVSNNENHNKSVQHDYYLHCRKGAWTTQEMKSRYLRGYEADDNLCH